MRLMLQLGSGHGMLGFRQKAHKDHQHGRDMPMQAALHIHAKHHRSRRRHAPLHDSHLSWLWRHACKPCGQHQQVHEGVLPGGAACSRRSEGVERGAGSPGQAGLMKQAQVGAKGPGHIVHSATPPEMCQQRQQLPEQLQASPVPPAHCACSLLHGCQHLLGSDPLF